LLRQGEGLVEPSGQLRFDFDSLEEKSAARESIAVAMPSVSFAQQLSEQPSEVQADELLQAAGEFEESGHLELAVEMCRAALAAGRPRPDVCFQLAALLYRLGDTNGACERYFTWQTFLRLAPDSPWADEARRWLSLSPSACVAESIRLLPKKGVGPGCVPSSYCVVGRFITFGLPITIPGANHVLH
jgi:hypothetical protein